MIDFIQEFIDSKSLSENSRNAYFYDLQQFVEAVDGKVSKEKLYAKVIITKDKIKVDFYTRDHKLYPSLSKEFDRW